MNQIFLGHSSMKNHPHFPRMAHMVSPPSPYLELRSGSVPLNSIPQFISGFSTLLKLPLMRVAGF